MVKPLDPEETWEYVLEEDRELPEEDQTVWTLQGLKAKDVEKVRNKLARMIEGQGDDDEDVQEYAVSMGSLETAFIKKGVASWVNWIDPRTREEVKRIQDVNGDLAYAVLDRLSPANRSELSRAVQAGSVAMPEDLANLPSPS